VCTCLGWFVTNKTGYWCNCSYIKLFMIYVPEVLCTLVVTQDFMYLGCNPGFFNQIVSTEPFQGKQASSRGSRHKEAVTEKWKSPESSLEAIIRLQLKECTFLRPSLDIVRLSGTSSSTSSRCGFAYSNANLRCSSRVTRLGEFSPIRWLIYLDSFL
jgi:hypothetical protein